MHILPKQASFYAILSTGRWSCGSLDSKYLFYQCGKILLEVLLFLFISLRMERTWYQLSSLLPFQESIDRRFIYFIPTLFSKA